MRKRASPTSRTGSTSWRTKATTRPFWRSTHGKIPAIYDPDGPSGTPLALFESGAILLYLADKTGQFVSSDPKTHYETIQWVMWQMGGVGPMFGQVGFFNKFAGKAYEDKLRGFFDMFARGLFHQW